MDSIRATHRERRFRETTGLDLAVPDHRFALSDPAGYLELEESVKAHTFDLSQSERRLLSLEEGARHWYDTVFKPVVEIAKATSACRLLESMTDADAISCSGAASMSRWIYGWRIPTVAIEHGVANLEGAGARVGHPDPELEHRADLLRDGPSAPDRGLGPGDRDVGRRRHGRPAGQRPARRRALDRRHRRRHGRPPE